jgi:predicted DNA-binding transcriptional regulator AlpA
MATQIISPPRGGGAVGLPSEFGGQELERFGAFLERIYEIASGAVPRAIRRPRVLELVGIGRSHMYNLMDERSPAFDPTFPRPFRLGTSPNSPSVWWEHQVVDWLKSKAHAEVIEQQKATAHRHSRLAR